MGIGHSILSSGVNLLVVGVLLNAVYNLTFSSSHSDDLINYEGEKVSTLTCDNLNDLSSGKGRITVHVTSIYRLSNTGVRSTLVADVFCNGAEYQFDLTRFNSSLQSGKSYKATIEKEGYTTFLVGAEHTVGSGDISAYYQNMIIMTDDIKYINPPKRLNEEPLSYVEIPVEGIYKTTLVPKEFPLNLPKGKYIIIKFNPLDPTIVDFLREDNRNIKLFDYYPHPDNLTLL